MNSMNMINTVVFKKHAPHHFAVAKVFFCDEKFYTTVLNSDQIYENVSINRYSNYTSISDIVCRWIFLL